jgi:hypothetical protein
MPMDLLLWNYHGSCTPLTRTCSPKPERVNLRLQLFLPCMFIPREVFLSVHLGSHCDKRGLWDVEARTLYLDSWLTDGGKFVNLMNRPPFTSPGRFLILISVRGCRPQVHSAAGSIRSIETIHFKVTRTSDLPGCSIVPQPTTLPRAPKYSLCDRRTQLNSLVSKRRGFKFLARTENIHKNG